MARKSGEVNAAPQKPFVELAPSEPDIARVLAAWDKTNPINGSHAYLEQMRKISRCVLNDPIFAGRIHTDRRRNAVFPHYNSDGLCGFEIKNRDLPGSLPVVLKGVVFSATVR